MWRALTFYQLGAVLHDMLMKRPLFDDEVRTKNRYRVAAAVLHTTPEVWAPDAPSSVHSSLSFGDQMRKVEANLRVQVKAYPDEWIGILVSRIETVEKVADFLYQNGFQDNVLVQSSEEESRTFDPGRRIVVSTIYSSKGAEFRCVHFVAADDFPYFTREKAFTAVTRAKTTLDIYHEYPMTGALESAVAQPQEPNLGGLFE